MNIGSGITITGGMTITSVPDPTPGQQEYTTAGTYTWTAPEYVVSVCVVCVGGGGSAASSAPAAAGGAGGVYSSTAPGSGQTNTGGGGVWYDFLGVGNGGSGVIIIRAPAPASATTGSPTVTTVGNNTIYKFTGSGSITF